MSIHETVLRYEGPPRTSNENFMAQQRRIGADNALEAKIAQTDQEWKANENAKWEDMLEEKAAFKRLRETNRLQNAEVLQAAKATIAVRKRALEKQLERETTQYNSELVTQGKTFHKQRI